MAKKLRNYEFRFTCPKDYYYSSFIRHIQCISLLDALDYVLRDPSGYNDLEDVISVSIHEDFLAEK